MNQQGMKVGSSVWNPERYHRVMPRDLFNEAKALSMYLKFIEDYNSGRLPGGFVIRIDNSYPTVALSESGELYLPNVCISFEGEEADLTIGYNAGKDKKFPVGIACGDIWSVLVYTKDGQLSKEFLETFSTPPATPGIPVEIPSRWPETISFYKQLGVVGLWKADGILPQDFEFELLNPEFGFLLRRDADRVSSDNLLASFRGQPINFFMHPAEGRLRFQMGSGLVLFNGHMMSDEFYHLIEKGN